MDGNYVVHFNASRDLDIRPESDTASDVIVRATYHPTLETVGWDILKIETDARFPDEEQAFAAGYFEGFATSARIKPHVSNITHFQQVSPPVKASLAQSLAWLDDNLPRLATESPYWLQVSLLWDYFNGMHEGINAAGQEFSRYQLFELAALADIASIDAALKAEQGDKHHWHHKTRADFETWFHHTTHCSALFKLTEDRKDLLFGHCTWIFWPWMARVFKHITLNYNTPSNRAKTVSMSSWVGAMSSLDDFYSTSAGLTVLETSISVFRTDLWRDAQVGRSPDRLLYWMRAMVANRMTDSGKSWVDTFGQNNGGTYNNEWYVLDRKKFVPGSAPAHGLLTVANQLPTMICSQDMGDTLAAGYVPSYNVPVIKDVFEAAGYPDAIKRQDASMTLSYEDCARAQIFRRDHGKVKDLDTMKFMMQYNNYKHDKISNGNPMYAIASRGDKKASDPKAFGAIDAKISNVALADAGTIEAFSGPTPQQGPFSFDEPDVDIGPAEGVPVTPHFSWQRMTR